MSYGIEQTRDRLEMFIRQKQAEGFTIVRASPTTLLLDLDDDASVAQFSKVLPVMREHMGVTMAKGWRSKSGNLHIQLELAAPTDWQLRYAMQAALGSDGMREALNIKQKLRGIEEPSILLRPAGAEDDEDLHFIEQKEEP